MAPPPKAGSSRASSPPKDKAAKKKKKAKRATLSDPSSASEDEDELQLAALKSLFLKKIKKKDRVKKDKKKIIEVEQVVDPAKKYTNLSSRERIVSVIEDNRHLMKPQDFPILYSMSSIWSVFDLDTRNRIMNNYCSCQQRQYSRDRFPPPRGAPRGRGRPYY